MFCFSSLSPPPPFFYVFISFMLPRLLGGCRVCLILVYLCGSRSHLAHGRESKEKHTIKEENKIKKKKEEDETARKYKPSIQSPPH